MDEYILGILAAFAGAALFAVTNIIYKQYSDRISVVDVILTRVWISLPLACVLLLPIFNPNGILITQNGIIIQAMSMFVGLLLGDTFYFMSQNRIGVSRAYPIVSAYPMAVYFIAALYLGEPVFLSRIVGAIMVIIGVGIIGFERERIEEDIEESSGNDIHLIGFILALFTIVCWASSDILLQVGLTDMDPIDSNFIRILAGSLMISPGIFYGRRNRTWVKSRRLISVVLMTGFLGYAMTMLLITFAVSYVGATLNSIILAASPLISTPISIIFTEEKLTTKLVIGTILSFVGVVLVILIL